MPLQRLLLKPQSRQFVKFCIVGASSTLISFSIFSLLLYGEKLKQLLQGWLAGSPSLLAFLDAYDGHVQVAALIAFLFAVTNGFVWNNLWTFRMRNAEGARERYVKFVLVNVVGLLLNQGILFVTNRMLVQATGGRGWEPHAAFMVATAIVVFWNFNANRLWTFKTTA